MGSAKVTTAKPLPMENKTLKALSTIKNFFNKDRKKEKAKQEEIKETPKKNDTVANILDTFDKLRINEEPKQSLTEEAIEKEEDEFSNFTYKIIEDDRVRHSSEDSGFSESNEPIVKALEKLKIGEKKKKTQQVMAPRGPLRQKVSDYNVGPYSLGQSDVDRFKQISQINRNALSGGQVLVNATPDPQTLSEVDLALKQLETTQSSNYQPEDWDDIIEVIGKDSNLKDFAQLSETTFDVIDVPNFTIPEPNPIEEFSAAHNLPNTENSIDLTSTLLNFDHGSTYPTPPRSVPSPNLSESASFYPSTWDNSLSPERSSPTYYSDCEKYQEIPPYESPVFQSSLSPISENNERKRERTSSMTMKNFKDLQKEISNEFSKKDCCLLTRKSIKDVFDEHMGKLSVVERKNLCFGVAKLDIKTAHGVLHHILLNIASGKVNENLHTAMFVLICQRILAQTPTAFIGDVGLSLLKSAALRCPERPMFTRFIVHYVYTALKAGIYGQPIECVFHEVDAQGDNLVIACARAGDKHAAVLAEITRSTDAPPLFRIHHANADGYTALHVACSQHSAASPRLHTLHVLLEHANADLWKGDVKGGETALHLAVNSVNCDLRVIMMIFKQIDRKEWKKLAHYHNLSSVTPLEYARSATKSTTRQNYPHEVLDFLKKCR